VIEVQQARQLLLRESRPREVVEVGLAQARGHVLAQEVRAETDFPPTDRSAMDGFALRAADVVQVPRVVHCVGELRAGWPVGDLRVGAGTAVRVFTGAVVPPGADSVVMIEKTRPGPAEREVEILELPRPGQHVRCRGDDARRGQQILPAGVLIQAAEVAALAALGRTRVQVHRAPLVHVLSTGDELVEPGKVPEPHEVRNSNGPGLLAQLQQLGISGIDLGIAPDEPEPLRAALERGLAGDLLLVTGGVSVGAYDLVGSALARLGFQVLFHGVAMRPGKPALAGRRGRCLVIGLPGNPVSAFTAFAVLVAPALRSMLGLRRADDLEVRATLTAPLAAKPGRTTFHLARVDWVGDRWLARPTGSGSSGDVLSLVRANAYLVTSADGPTLEAGEQVQAVLWPESQLRVPTS
jgi:molybdopterin molybdotransferase